MILFEKYIEQEENLKDIVMFTIDECRKMVNDMDDCRNWNKLKIDIWNDIVNLYLKKFLLLQNKSNGREK